MSDSLNARYENVRATRGRIERTDKLCGGALFKSNHVILHTDVLDIRKSKDQSKNNKYIKVVQKAINQYNLQKHTYIKQKQKAIEEKNHKAKH